MRSRRKEVNKAIFKATEDAREPQGQDIMGRTTGIKPFQLVKIRQGQRSTFDLAHTNNEILHKRTGSNNLYSQEKEGIMDLIIQQKLIVQVPFTQKLESERRNVFPISSQSAQLPSNSTQRSINEPGKKAGEEYKQIYTESEEPYCFQTDINHQQSQQHQNNELESKKNRGKCESLQQDNQSINAIISLKHQQHEIHLSPQEKEGSAEQLKVTEETIQELKAMKQKALPPFSFTSTKWRSKSQILQVDKWKEKYGKDTPLTHKLQSNNKPASVNKFDKKSKEGNPYSSLQDDKVVLPILHKSKQLDTRMKIFKFSPTKREQQRQAIKNYFYQGTSRPNYLQLTHDNFKKKIKKSEEERLKRENQEKNQIAIRKMYEAKEQKKQYLSPTEEISPPKQEEKIVEESQSLKENEKQKAKRKKSKFPQIQISTFYSSKDQEEERRRLRLQNLQRLARQWRFNPPKKTYIRKIMEEIPERWEYGESRDSSRQVDNYILHKQQEAKREYFVREMEENKMKLQVSSPKNQEEYLCGAQIFVRQ